ncbi:MAG: PEP-CTERM sorting domain-containing protein [Gluconacetobacter diazotrophicus]|nr:PEP-CTERM sorting domain-containing protein [Gluconacetobacter diazotrophicus]
MKHSAKAITLTGLAGASAFAGATQSYGTVVSVAPPTNITGNAPNTAATSREYYNVDTGATYTTSAGHTGTDYIQFSYINSSTYNESFTGLYDYGGKPAAYLTSGGTAYPYPLAQGAKIGTGGMYAFNQVSGRLAILSLSYNGSFYAFNAQNTMEYVGFQFTSSTDGLIHNGWVELESVSNDGTDLDGGLKFFGVAYNTVPDAQGGYINAGQLSGGNAVPEPGTLAALAVGAAALGGVGLQRRRRQIAAAEAA